MTLTLTGTRMIILRMMTMVMIEKDVFCLFKRVEEEKSLVPMSSKLILFTNMTPLTF